MKASFKFGKSYTIKDFKALVGASKLCVREHPISGIMFFTWSPNKGDSGLVSRSFDFSKEAVITAVSWEASDEYPAGSGYLLHNRGGEAVCFTANPHKGFLNSKIQLTSKASETIQVHCAKSNMIYTLSPGEIKHIRFDAPGTYVLQCDDWQEQVVIEDAIRLGGSEFEHTFTFDSTPWILLCMKDRTYFYNRQTKEQYYENDITPEVVLEVSNRYLLFGNTHNSDCALYSLEERKIVKYFRNILIFKNDYVIFKEKEVISVLYLYSELRQENYNVKSFKIYEEHETIAYINENNEICYLFLKDGSVAISSIEGQFISFLSTAHVVSYSKNSYYNIIVTSLHNKKEYKIHLSTPIANCCGISMIGDAQDNLAFLISYKEKDDNIRKLVDIEKILLHNEQVFILKRYYEYNSRNNSHGYLSRGIYTLEDSNNNILVQFSSGEYPTFIQKENRLLITTSKRLIYLDPSISLQIPNAQLISDYDEIFYSKEENGKYQLCKLYNIKLNVSDTPITKEYVSCGIVKIGDDFFDFTINKSLKCSLAKKIEDSLVLYNKDSAVCYLYLEHTLYRVDEKWNDIQSISKNGNTIVIKNGDQFRVGVINRQLKKYDIEPLVISELDLSRYSNPLFTDTKENILCRKGNKYILYNLINGLEQDFETNNFVVKGINGYRPIIHKDANRRPVLIDPITMHVAPSEILSSDYSFVSPSGRYRADYKRLFKNKHTNQVVSELECYDWMKDYSIDNLSPKDEETKEKIAQNRRSFVLAHLEYFDRHISKEQDEKKIEEELNYISRSMRDVKWMHCCFNELVIIHDNKLNQDIKIEAIGMFWFKNYIAFSYDDKYVAIAARYPNETNEGGYFALYDLEQKTSIVSMTKYDNRYTLDAVWVSAFTKRSKVAFYTSEPHTFIVEPTSRIVKRIEGTSFLCYSPDGKYMALSNQGYIQYEDRWLYGTWGHQRSSIVYIYDTETLSHVKTLSCFFGEKITGVRERSGSVASVAFSQDNSQLLVSSDDGVVVIYNLEM